MSIQEKTRWFAEEVILTPPNKRHTTYLEIRNWRGGPNKYGVEPLRYETNQSGMRTDWVEFKCKCGREGSTFWSTEKVSEMRGCTKCCPVTEDGKRDQSRLKLTGQRFRHLLVKGHVKGRGWMVECDCGRHRNIMNGTMLAAGVYKTCGQCTYEERTRTYTLCSSVLAAESRSMNEAASTSTAPQSSLASLRDGIVADWTTAGVICVAQDHRPIMYGGGGDCPLCSALARIELLEADLRTATTKPTTRAARP